MSSISSQTTKFEWKLEKSDNEENSARKLKKELIYGPEIALKSDKNAKFSLFATYNKHGHPSSLSIGLILKNNLSESKNLEINGFLRYRTSRVPICRQNVEEYHAKKVAFKNANDKWEPTLNKEDKRLLNEFYYRGFSHEITFCCEVIDSNPIQFDANFVFRQKLWESYKNGMKTDVTIQVKEDELKVHQVVLISQSEVFQTMLTTLEFKEAQENLVKIEDFKLPAVEAFIEWMYLGEVENFESHAEDLFAISDKYQVKQLKDQCAKELSKSLNDENLAQRFILSILHDHEPLKNRIVDFISQKRTIKVVRFFLSPEWISFVQSYGHLASDMMKNFENKLSDSEDENEDEEDSDDSDNSDIIDSDVINDSDNSDMS